MIVLSLSFNNNFEFIKEDIQNLKEVLKKSNINISIAESIENDSKIIEIICKDQDFNKNLCEKINLYISNILFKVVVDEYRKKEMLQFLSDTYFFLQHEEILIIEENVMKILNMNEKIDNEIFIYCFNKINDIISKIKECIDENKNININGFITFRMRELREDIECIVDKVVEKYIVEKEYEEFIRLLKYFVDIQESKIDLVNIIINDNGMYVIEDEKGRDIFSLFLKELGDSELNILDTNIEDIIISGLITNVPKKIIIKGYNNCKNIEFINTITNVFGDRVEFNNETIKKNYISKNKVLTE